MRSPHLDRQIASAFGAPDGATLEQTLAPLHAAGLSDVAAKFESLLAAVDDTYVKFAPVQRAAAKAKHLFDRLDLSGDIACEWNLASRTILSSTAWRQRFGFGDDPAEVPIGVWSAWVHPDDKPLLRERHDAVLKGRAPLIEFEHRLRAPGDEWRWWLLRGRVASRDAHGRTTRLLVLHRDISEQKRVETALLQAKEEAETANRARGAFLANMSHEIRTPMNAILGMTELALDTPLEDEQRSYLTTVKSSAEALLTIINDILDLSKIEAGKIDLETVVFPLRTTLADSLRGLAVAAQRKGLEVMLDVAADLPDRVYGDPTRLRQILANLVGNAIKFTERGEISIQVSLLRRSEMSLYLQVAVRDTGIGIAADQHEQIFDAFAQADVSTTRRFGGTGLGLSISHSLVKLMDGRLWLESEPGSGSTFYFTLRLAAEGSEAVPAAPTAGLQGRRALVVDDNPRAAELLARMLQRLGIAAETAHDAGAVPALLGARRQAGQPFELLLVDAGMRAPGGFALAAAVAKGGGGEALIMLLVNHGQRQALERLGLAAIRSNVVKPVFEADLLDALNTAFGLDELASVALDAFTVGDPVDADGEAEPLNVLLAEDTPVNQTLAVQLLKKAGHRVTVANNGLEALECFERQRFDLVLMDLQMPVMDGMEATGKIRASEMRRSWFAGENQRLCYIAAMTAHAMDGDRERCLAGGMDDYLSKPIRREAFDDVLRRALAHRRAPAPSWSDMVQGWRS